MYLRNHRDLVTYKLQYLIVDSVKVMRCISSAHTIFFLASYKVVNQVTNKRKFRIYKKEGFIKSRKVFSYLKEKDIMEKFRKYKVNIFSSIGITYVSSKVSIIFMSLFRISAIVLSLKKR